ncbi:hypothetical protein [Salinibacillus xinjiangensis]|uniref:Uncharacterized protein n=1 Tax=Salinibacillus xinjiangensis TaxID=1229268 RepID=A0A6G1XBJ9_9BACI|nr:hypothetical protein [Salinibacillus xinjiangensis]MRG88285.1 hypothetical protein [Salinibacillus xinjiangensis]
MNLAYKKVERKMDRKVSRLHVEKALEELEEKVRVIDQNVSVKADQTVESLMYKQQKEIRKMQLSLAEIYEKLDVIQKRQNRMAKEEPKVRERSFPFVTRFTQWVKMWT